jgi:hypothetical protein
MHDLTSLPSLLGGVVIGLAAALLLLTHGRIAGISGIVGGLLRADDGSTTRSLRLPFVAGLLTTGALLRWLAPTVFDPPRRGWLLGYLAAGVLVGVGTQLGGGCTSGHGVCGIGRLSRRSVLATLTFMATGLTTVHLLRHLWATRLGGGS